MEPADLVVWYSIQFVSHTAGRVYGCSKVIPTFLFIFLAPLIGMVVAFIITLIIVNVCRHANPYKADNWFRRLQLISSGLLSLGHGGNDAQKVMGIIGAAMIWYEKSMGHELSFKQFIDHNMWVPRFDHWSGCYEASFRSKMGCNH